MKLDVMPTDETILGFSNRWYKPAIEAATVVELDGFELRVVTTPYFIGTKLEAFRGRGKGDFYASSDLEDIISVLDGRSTLVDDARIPRPNSSATSAEKLANCSTTPNYLNALPGHLAGDEISQARIPMILRTLQSLRGLAPKSERSTKRKKQRRVAGLQERPFRYKVSPRAASTAIWNTPTIWKTPPPGPRRLESHTKKQDVQISLPRGFIWKLANAVKTAVMKITTPNRTILSDVHCAFIQFSDPVTLTDTSEKVSRRGFPSAVPR